MTTVESFSSDPMVKSTYKSVKSFLMLLLFLLFLLLLSSLIQFSYYCICLENHLYTRGTSIQKKLATIYCKKNENYKENIMQKGFSENEPSFLLFLCFFLLTWFYWFWFQMYSTLNRCYLYFPLYNIVYPRVNLL